jgi:hypothetical protein
MGPEVHEAPRRLAVSPIGKSIHAGCDRPRDGTLLVGRICVVAGQAVVDRGHPPSRRSPLQ